MNAYEQRAMDLQLRVIASEDKQLDQGDADYTPERERQAIVHTRQDLVLLISYLSAVNLQVAAMRRLLWVMTLALGVLVIDHFV
jgi:hypothetical protein